MGSFYPAKAAGAKPKVLGFRLSDCGFWSNIHLVDVSAMFYIKGNTIIIVLP